MADVAALVLAAGRSSRAGGSKLLAMLDGKPLLRHAVDAALASRAASVTVVTGHAADAVAAALAGSGARLVHNPRFAEGLSTSLATGIGAIDADGALVVLADMPRVTAATIDRLIAAFEAGAEIVVPTNGGRRGNPVLWHRRYFGELATLSGDTGARSLIERHASRATFIEIGPEVALDLDTPEDIAAAGGLFP
jgi:molybdenum cofactor cytidylyltransferase